MLVPFYWLARLVGKVFSDLNIESEETLERLRDEDAWKEAERTGIVKKPATLLGYYKIGRKKYPYWKNNDIILGQPPKKPSQKNTLQ